MPRAHQERKHKEFHEWGWNFCDGCGGFHEPGRMFYVSVIRNAGLAGRTQSFLAGPFFQHSQALALVDVCAKMAEETDPACAFDSFGTCSMPGESSVTGRLNEQLTVGHLYPNAV